MTTDWRALLKVWVPAVLSAVASITVAYLKHKDATDETKRAYAALARNFNEHLVEHRAEHDDLLKLVGTVQTLTTLAAAPHAPPDSPLASTTGRKKIRGKWHVTSRPPAPPAAPAAEKVEKMNQQLEQVRGRKADLPPLPAAY